MPNSADAYPFRLRRVAGDDLDITHWHAEAAREKPHQFFIGCAFDRRRGDANFKRTVV